MIPLLASTVISCADAISIFNRVTSVVGLTPKQKIEIVTELKKTIHSCPVIIKPNELKQKQSNRPND